MPRSRMPPSPWVALLLSLAAHGLIGLALALLPARVFPGPSAVEYADLSDGNPVPVQLMLADATPRPATSARGPMTGGGEESGTDDIPVRLVDGPSRPRDADAPPRPSLPTPRATEPPRADHALPGRNTPVAPSAEGLAGGGGAAEGDGSAGGRGGNGLPAAPPSARRVVYVVDRSVSMGEGRALAAAGRAVCASLRRLPAGSVFQVVVFNGSADLLAPGGDPAGMLAADGAAVRRVAAAFRSLPATGNTRPAEAVLRGLKYRPDVLYLLTDSDDLPSGDVARLARAAGGRTVIHAVELTDRRAGGESGPLAELAARTRGTFRRVATGG